MRVRLIDTVANKDTLIENSLYYKESDFLPIVNKSCESLSFILPDNLLANAKTYKIVLENRSNQAKISRENAYMFVVNRRPDISSISASTPPIQANYTIDTLIIRGSHFVSVEPKSIVKFNDSPLNNISSITPNEIRIMVPGILVKSGNNRISITNPGSNIIEFTNNLLTENSSRTIFGNFADSSTVFANGIVPTNAQLIKPQKVVFSANSDIYDTTFFARGINVYKESRLLYNGSFDSCSFNLTSQILNNVQKIHITREGIDTLRIANPYYLNTSSTTPNYYLSNPMLFRAYDAAQLPKVDSASPKQIRPSFGQRTYTLYGTRFDSQTLIRCTFFPISGSPTAADTIIIPQEFGQPSSSTQIPVSPPSSFVNREGILSFQALHPDTVGVKEYGRVNITNRYPVIESISVEYERKVETPRLLSPPAISYISEKSDSVYAGTGGENKSQRYFRIKGRNFLATAQYTRFFPLQNPRIIMNGQTLSLYDIFQWVQSDTDILFGYSTNIPIPDDRFITFAPGLFKFGIINEEGVQTESLFEKNILSPKPTIESVRKMPNKELIPNNQNATSGITLGYRDSIRVRIYSGGSEAPNAKNFVNGARVIVNGRPKKDGLETTFIENAAGDDKYSLEVSIPAIYLSAYNINSLVVSNPGTGTGDGGNSTPYYFKSSITYPTPTIEFVNPTKIPVGTTDTLITIRGQYFTPNTSVRVRRFDSLETDPLVGTYPVYSEENLPIIQLLDSTGLVVRLSAKWRSRIAVDSLLVCNPTAPGFSSSCAKALITIVAPPPTITQITPSPLEAYIPGEPSKADTITISGNGFDANTRVWWNDTLQLRIIGQSSTQTTAFVPDSLHKALGQVLISLKTPDSLSTQGFVTLAYPKTEVYNILPNPIELPDLPAMIAYKEGGNLTAANGQRSEFPVYAGLPTSVQLFPNAPNPFDGMTSIEYAVPDDATLGIEILDPLGRKIADLVPPKLYKAGFYTVQWNAGHQTASGVYTAVLQSTDTKGKLTRKTLRMTLIR